jgi:NAD(P)-dependent dehydrogenase (short-subunit alcohol dehydrogenase family)
MVQRPHARAKQGLNNMPRLRDKVVLVTGAAGAIGRAIARAIEAEGGTAIRSDLAGRGNVRHTLDVTAESDWHRVAAVIAETTGRLDGLVNAAGIVAIGSVEDTDFDTWRRVMAINLDGTFLGCKYALPLLKSAGGSIVNISSVSGLVGGHNLAAYNASKGGVRLLTKSVALHGARLKPPVRCNSVHPAFIEGPMAEGMIAQFRDPARAREKLAASVPLGRFGTPAEVAELAVYLLSEESAFVTGAEFVLDGGLTAQ